jgi:hypothetical protein
MSRPYSDTFPLKHLERLPLGYRLLIPIEAGGGVQRGPKHQLVSFAWSCLISSNQASVLSAYFGTSA